jgi:hypothetical protein
VKGLYYVHHARVKEESFPQLNVPVHHMNSEKPRLQFFEGRISGWRLDSGQFYPAMNHVIAVTLQFVKMLG